MRALAYLIFIALICALQGLPSTYIVGGKDAPISKHPYVVSLRLKSLHICSGSILNQWNILTSARCIWGLQPLLNYLKVHAGTHLLDKPGAVYNISNITINRNFDGYNNDIALIHLQTPITYNTLVQSITFMTNDENLEGKSCTLSGWGTTTLGGSLSNNLQEIDMIISSQQVCKIMHPRVTNSNICSLTVDGKGACMGDGGAPLVVDKIQVGIVSNFECGSHLLDVFTKVSYFRTWINTNLI